MERTKIYYKRDDQNRPLVTVCLLQANGDIARGIAICSVLDNPCKKTGRKIAKDRATHAMRTRRNTCPIHRPGIHIGFRRVGEQLPSVFNWSKSAFNPPLTELENRLVFGEV